MSTIEDSSSDDESAPLKQDIISCIDILGQPQSSTTVMSEGNVTSSDSNKNPENIGALSVMHQSETTTGKGTNNESGDTTKDPINKNVLQTDKKSLLQSSEPLSKTEIVKDNGDHSVINDECKRKYDQMNSELNIATTSESDNNRRELKLGGKTSAVDVCDEEMDDDDMELRWEDDDGSDQVRKTDNDKNIDSVEKDHILSDQQLLGDQVVTEGKLKLDICKDDDIISEEELLEEKGTADGNVDDDKLSEKLLLEDQVVTDGNENLHTVTNDDILSEELLLEDQILTDGNENLNTVKNYDILPEKLLLEDAVVIDSNVKLHTVENEEILSETLFLEDQEVTDVDENLHTVKNDDILSETLLLEDEVLTHGNENLHIVKNDDILSETPFLKNQVVTDTNEKLQTVKNCDILPKTLVIEDHVLADGNSKHHTSKNEDINFKKLILENQAMTDVSKKLDIVKNYDLIPEEVLLDEVVAYANKNLNTVKNDDSLHEQQLLEESEHEIGSEIIPDKDVLKNEETYETTLEKDTYLKETNYDNKNLEDGLAKDIHNEKSVDPHSAINVGEDKLPVGTNLLTEKETKTNDNIQPDILSVESGENKVLQENQLEPIGKGKECYLETNVMIKKHLDKNNDILPEDNLLDVIEEIPQPPKVNAENVVSIGNVDAEKEEELLRDDQYEDESCTAMDVDITDQSIDDQIKTQENNVSTRFLTDSNTADPDITMESAILEDSNVLYENEDDNEAPIKRAKLELSVNNKLEVLPTKDVKKTDTEFDQSISLVESPIRIKTDHGLHKPDVMLEIPTQELIEIDEADFSINLDPTESIHSPNDVKNITDDVEEIVNEKTLVTENTVEKDMADDSSSISNVENVKNTEKQQTIEESLEIMFADHSPEAVKDVALCEASTSNALQDINVQSATTSKTLPEVDVQSPSTSETLPEVDLQSATTSKTLLEVHFQSATTSKTLQEVDVQSATTSITLPEVDVQSATTSKTLSEVDMESATTSKTPQEVGVQAVTASKPLQEVDVQSTTTSETHQEVDVQTATATKTLQEVDVQPSTSLNKMTPDTSDEVPEVSDSLGLLAESSGRMMEDDEEPDDDDEGDEDDDFEDESSNQISAEQSEDSNAPPSETEPVRDRDEKDIETPDVKEEFQFNICDIESTTQDKMGNKEVVEINMEYTNLELPAETVQDDGETQSAVDALLKEVENVIDEVKGGVNQDSADQQMDIETVKLSDTSDNEAEANDVDINEMDITEVDINEVELDIKEDGKTAGVEDQTETKEPGNEDAEELQDKTIQSPSKQSPTKQSSVQSPNKQSPSKQSPSKAKKLEIKAVDNTHVVNYVDLEESSSSEDDVQEVQKQSEPETSQPKEEVQTPDPDSVTNVNIPSGIEVMCTSGGSTSEMVTKEGEVVISGIPKPPPHKPARLNTSEVSIKTASTAEPLVIPETKINEQTSSDQMSKPKLSLEIFNLDSDEDDSAVNDKPGVTSPHKMTALELETARETSKCINYCCTSDNKVPYKLADAATVAYYDAGRKRRAMVCQTCAEVVNNRTKNLIQGIKDMTPLLDLEMGNLSQDLVEISDSESEDEEMTPEEPKESIGEKGAKLLEENLAAILNETWLKYDLDTRIKETQIMLDDEIEKLEQDSKEIDAMLNECQIATDKLRCELYATFEVRRQENPPWCIYDTPEQKYIGYEVDPSTATAESSEVTSSQAKRRLSSTSETPAKRPAIPLGYAPLDTDTSTKEPKAVMPAIESKLDDDKDISVVQLSAESAPADLPPSGEISRPPIRVGMPVYAMKNAFGPWLKGRILDIQPRNPATGHPYPLCRIKFDHKAKNSTKVLPARCIAYAEPADVRMTIGTRLIALFKDTNKRESYYSGVVAEIPNPVNNYRYLVFFDDGYAQYVQHAYTRLVCECASLVWDEVHPFSREFVKQYLITYPERPMVRLHEGQHLKTEWNGKWWSSRVIRVDASLAQVLFVGDGRREWIYRGSTRLAPLYLELRAAERHRPRPMPRSKAQPRSNMPYVEYTRSDEPDSKQQQDSQAQEQSEEIRRQRAVAKKSTTASPPQIAPQPPQQPQHPIPPQQPGNLDTVTSRVVYYTPKNAIKPHKMTPHKCGPECNRTDVLSLKELRTYNPLAKPLLSGWERQIVRYKGHKDVMYRAPCGRRLRNMSELHRYLRAIDSELPVDLFDFHYSTHCLAEFVLNKCLVGKKDLSHGKENVPVPCVNYYDDSLPEFCSYNTERTPTAGVPLNLDPEFLCGCDCTDDCQDKTKCACWKMTLEGARTIGLDYPDVGYVHKRLPEPLPSGIYECNSRCKCKHTCLNRVAQHPLQLKLQVFKTLNRGWGIRALNDVPKGSFLCVYAGNLLTDATANLDGLNEGDEYLAELDYIEVVEQMKEGYEEDIPAIDKKLDKKELAKNDDADEEDEPQSSEDEGSTSKTDKEDDDFRPGYIGLGVQEFSKRLRRREKSKKEKEAKKGDDKDKEKEKEKETKDGNAEEDCITISDDEEVREPSRFTVQAGMGANEFISKYQSVRTLFGKDEACYIMDAKVQGNIGRYLNHSCCPNVFVQNVFVDTHDPRFPWVAFFALSHIKAGTELTWNYNYDVGSVPGKVLYCFCGAPNCRGRLL